MRYIAYWDTQKIKIIEVKSGKSIKLNLEFTPLPNIPRINYMDSEFLEKLVKEIKSTNTFWKNLFWLRSEIFVLTHLDFTTDENEALMIKFLNEGFKAVFLIEKSRLLNKIHEDSQSHSYLSIYSNERNTIISKVKHTAPIEYRVFSNISTKEIINQMESYKKENPLLKVHGENSELCDVFLGEDDIWKNMIYFVKNTPRFPKEFSKVE